MNELRGTDLHSHLIPGVDDGSAGEAYSAGALEYFRREGVGQIVTTPHFMGSLTRDPAQLADRLAELDAGWAVLQRLVREDAERAGTPLRVERGAEVMLDVPDPDVSDARLRLAGGPYVLVEFPGLHVPPINAEFAIVALRERGWRAVVAHPERYRNLDSGLTTIARFKQAGAVLQMNAGSLLGGYGTTAAGQARRLLALGWIDFVSSDYHARGEPGVAAFAAALVSLGASEHAELLTVVNPARVLAGELPLPVPPMDAVGGDAQEARPLWSRLFGKRRGGSR